jgi:thiamine biosynthesis lipoprotein
MKRFGFIVVLSLVGIFFLWSGCSRSDPERILYAWGGQTMGTTYEVKIYFEELTEEDRFALQKKVEAELVAVNAAMSTWIQDSEISTFNQLPAGEEMQIGLRFQTVLQRSIDLNGLTEQAFDPTLSPLIDLWGFGAAKPLGAEPKKDQIEQALARMGMDKVVLEGNKLSKALDGVQINLSAIAKGYGVDQVAKVLEAEGITTLYVEIGGEVICRGKKPGNAFWHIGIQVPTPGAEISSQRIVKLYNKALATSGDYRNFHETEKGKRHHILDPRTGMPAGHSLASVSVVADDCMTADAVATALYVMGTEQGMNWLTLHPELNALFIDRTETGFKMTATQGFQTLMIEP